MYLLNKFLEFMMLGTILSMLQITSFNICIKYKHNPKAYVLLSPFNTWETEAQSLNYLSEVTQLLVGRKASLDLLTTWANLSWLGQIVIASSYMSAFLLFST